MKLRIVALSLISLSLLTGFGLSKKTPDQKRTEIDQMVGEVLADLYREIPSAEDYVEDAYGYAVFSSFGMNVFVVSTASGKGLAQYPDQKVYMKMYSAGTGVGMGVKDFRLVFTFANRGAMDGFVNEGWTAGAQADAAAAYEDDGDAAALAIDVSPGVKLFQMTEAGLALQATIQGTKYLKDDDLN